MTFVTILTKFLEFAYYIQSSSANSNIYLCHGASNFSFIFFLYTFRFEATFVIIWVCYMLIMVYPLQNHCV